MVHLFIRKARPLIYGFQQLYDQMFILLSVDTCSHCELGLPSLR